MIDGESQTINNHVALKFLETRSSQITRTYPTKSAELQRRAQEPDAPSTEQKFPDGRISATRDREGLVVPEPVRALAAERFTLHEGANDGAMVTRDGVRAGAVSWLAPTVPARGQELSVPVPRFEGLDFAFSA